jgi:hypothetical protein
MKGILLEDFILKYQICVWQCTPVIPQHRMLGQKIVAFQGHPSYIVRFCFNNNNKKSVTSIQSFKVKCEIIK